MNSLPPSVYLRHRVELATSPGRGQAQQAQGGGKPSPYYNTLPKRTKLRFLAEEF